MNRTAQTIEMEMPDGDVWAVGVSGGADSVALLVLLSDRPGLRLRVVHLNHELRGAEAEGDAEFVRELSGRLGLQCDIVRRREIEPELVGLSSNPSARYREIRLALFRRVVEREKLCGVMLAHHADDQAETVLQRLLRGSNYAGLAGMKRESLIGGLRIIRPLLKIRRGALREMLRERGQAWREDASNLSEKYLRNRLRKLLAENGSLTDELLKLSAACRRLAGWTSRAAPKLETSFPSVQLAKLPSILARRAARRWLIGEGAARELPAGVLDRLVGMAADAATAHVQEFPGGVLVRRRAGRIYGENAGD